MQKSGNPGLWAGEGLTSEKVFDSTYTIKLLPMPYTKDQDILNTQKDFLQVMRRGDSHFLATRLYSDPYYQKPRPGKIAFVAKGGTK